MRVSCDLCLTFKARGAHFQDVKETAKDYRICCDLPGVEKDKIDVSVDVSIDSAREIVLIIIIFRLGGVPQT